MSEVIKAMESKIAEQEKEKAALEHTIVSLTNQLKAKEVELSEQVKAKDEELRQMKRELDATEGGRAHLQRELTNVREAAALLSSSASVRINLL
jgi:predicted RNase H-like nuclease (RuvC/YqgF family)